MSRSSETNKLIDQADALIAVDRFAEAGALLAQGLSQEPENYTLLCQMVQVLQGTRQTERAYELVKRAIAVEPERGFAHRLRSAILRDGLRPHDSVEAAKKAARLEPNSPINWLTLAHAQLHVFNLDEARAAAERLRELAPEWYLSHQTLALVAIKAEKFKEAEEHCRRELQLNPLSYEGMNNLGVAFSRQNRKRDAVSAFHAAAKIDPSQSLARENLNSAVSSYLPKIGVSFGALWLFFQLLRVLAGIPGREWIAGVILGIALSVIAGYFVLRLYRYWRMPPEIRRFYQLVNRKQRLSSRRDLFRAIWVIAAVVFGLWSFVLVALWTDLSGRMSLPVLLIPPGTLLVIGMTAFAGYWNVRRELALLQD